MNTLSQDFGIGVRRGQLRTCWSITVPYIGQIWNQSPIYQLPGMWQSGAFGDTYLCFQKRKHKELLIDESKSIPGTVWGVIIWQHFTVPTAGNVIMWVVIVHPPIAAPQAEPHSRASSVSTKGAAMFKLPSKALREGVGAGAQAEKCIFFLPIQLFPPSLMRQDPISSLPRQIEESLEPSSGFMKKVHLGAGEDLWRMLLSWGQCWRRMQNLILLYFLGIGPG